MIWITSLRNRMLCGFFSRRPCARSSGAEAAFGQLRGEWTSTGRYDSKSTFTTSTTTLSITAHCQQLPAPYHRSYHHSRWWA